MLLLLVFQKLFLKILSEILNTVDPDQTAPGSALTAYVNL